MSEPDHKPLLWIVDDSPLERLAAQRALAADYELEELVDGADVIERLERGSTLPTLILLDWVMPNLSGDEVCKYLRSHEVFFDVPIVLFTASRVETADIVEGLALGANDYVPKPFAPEELRARVRAVLRSKELRDAASRERTRLAAINRLGRALFGAGPDIHRILNELLSSLQGLVADGCAIMLLPGELPQMSAAVHVGDPGGAALSEIATLTDPRTFSFDSSEMALAQLPPRYHPYIRRFGLRGLAILPFPIRSAIQGIVTLTRDGNSQPFDGDDLAAIETCIDYVSLAIQNAARFEVERAAREQLRAVAVERERVAAFQEQMLSIVGHDLRNPISAIMTGAELLLQQGGGNPEMRSSITRIQRSSRRMKSIVGQLLDMTHVRLGEGIPLVPVAVSLAALVSGVVDEARAAFPSSTFELVADEVSGHWDPDRLSQVFSNLIGNAVQYGHATAPIVITVAAKGQRAIVSVANALRDDPIPLERIAALFEPYRRGEGSSVAHRSGLGLGLYISHEIVAAHHGQITVQSSTAGTVFTVALPLLT